jgi:hypothetical protein
LATAIGYNRIPADWLEPVKRAEDMDFAYLPYSLNDTYDMSFRHALAMIEREGGVVTDSDVTIKCQRPRPVQFEQSFPGIAPSVRNPINVKLGAEEYSYTAECAGIIFNGYVSGPKEYVAELEVSVDGGAPERFTMPVLYRVRRLDVYWNFELKPGNHTITLRWLNPTEGTSVKVVDAVLFESRK